MAAFLSALGLPPGQAFDSRKAFVASSFPSRISPFTLSAIRGVISIYIFITLIVAYSYLAHSTNYQSLRDVNIPSYWVPSTEASIGQSFSFFTFLTFWAMGFYFLVASVHGFVYARYGRTWLHESWPRWLQICHHLFYTTITTFPYLVSIVFWGTMYGRHWPPAPFVQWLNISVHGLNSVFATLEIVVAPTSPPPWSHLGVDLVILSVYLGLAYLTKYTQGIYVYEWLNPAHGSVSIVLHVLCYAILMIAIFVAVWAAIWFRQRLTAAKVASGHDHALNACATANSSTQILPHDHEDGHPSPQLVPPHTNEKSANSSMTDLEALKRGGQIEIVTV